MQPHKQVTVQNRFSKCNQINVSAKVQQWNKKQPKDMSQEDNTKHGAPAQSKNNDDSIFEEVKVTSLTSKENF